MKVKLTWNGEDGTWWQPLDSPELHRLLKDNHEIEVVDELGHADVHVLDCSDPEAPFSRACPTIIFDRHDTSFVTDIGLSMDLWSNVIGYIVPTFSMSTEKARRYVRKSWTVKTSKTVRALNTTLWRYRHSLYSGNVFAGVDFKMPKKDIDVFFMGTVYYPSCPYASAHRQRLMAEWKQVASSGVGVFSGVRPNPRVIDEQSHSELLQRSKVAVCPWGVTESCWRDFEAVLSECVIVKPDPFRISNGCYSPWHEDNCVPCKEDYSDLREAVNVALHLRRNTDLRKHRELMYHESELAQLARYFAGDIKACLSSTTRQSARA